MYEIEQVRHAYDSDERVKAPLATGVEDCLLLLGDETERVHRREREQGGEIGGEDEPAVLCALAEIQRASALLRLHSRGDGGRALLSVGDGAGCE